MNTPADAKKAWLEWFLGKRARTDMIRDWSDCITIYKQDTRPPNDGWAYIGDLFLLAQDVLQETK